MIVTCCVPSNISRWVEDSRLKKIHLDDVESMKDECREVVTDYRLAKGSARGAIVEMKRLGQ